MANERTLILVKPDGVQRGLIADITKRFEQKGFKLVGLKFTKATEDLFKQHYAALSKQGFFAGLIKFSTSGPVVPMVWEGKDIVRIGRQMLGETDPAKSNPGTIRGDLCVDITRNIVHGSDSIETAKREIKLWFKDDELVNWTPHGQCCVYSE